MAKNKYIIEYLEQKLEEAGTVKSYDLTQEKQSHSVYQLTIVFSERTDRTGRKDIVSNFVSEIRKEFDNNNIQTKILNHRDWDSVILNMKL